MKDNDDKKATLFTCLRILSDGVSKLPIKVHDNDDQDSRHQLSNILKLRPNKLMSAATFWRTIEYQVNWYGYSVVPIEKVNGKVKSLIPLDMDNVEMYVDDIGLLDNKKNPVYF